MSMLIKIIKTYNHVNSATLVKLILGTPDVCRYQVVGLIPLFDLDTSGVRLLGEASLSHDGGLSLHLSHFQSQCIDLNMGMIAT